jgi:Flp pilus assembly protein TadB
MIGLGIALLVVGVVFLFFVPWVGIPVGIVGLVLLVAFLLGFRRHPREPRVTERPPT